MPCHATLPSFTGKQTSQLQTKSWKNTHLGYVQWKQPWFFMPIEVSPPSFQNSSPVRGLKFHTPKFPQKPHQQKHVNNKPPNRWFKVTVLSPSEVTMKYNLWVHVNSPGSPKEGGAPVGHVTQKTREKHTSQRSHVWEGSPLRGCVSCVSSPYV